MCWHYHVLCILPIFFPLHPYFFPSSPLPLLMPSHAVSSKVTNPDLIDDHCTSSQSLISKLTVLAVVTNSMPKNMHSMLREAVLCILCCSL